MRARCDSLSWRRYVFCTCLQAAFLRRAILSMPRAGALRTTASACLLVCILHLQGCCTAEDCPYLHVNLAAAAPVCKRFLRGYCPAGTACLHKHYTLRMVREEKTLAAGAGGKVSSAGAARARRTRAPAFLAGGNGRQGCGEQQALGA